MKKITILLLLVFMGYSGVAQLTLTDGSILTTDSGATMFVKGDLNSDNASLENNGTLIVEGNLVNNSSSLFSTASAGTFVFAGGSAQEITGDTDAGFYGTTTIDNTNGIALTTSHTGSNQTINGELQFVSGKIVLNDLNLILGTTNPSGQSADNYVQTNGMGELKRIVPADGSTEVIFPVGNSSYNPLILKNDAGATTDNYGVVVLDHEPSDAATDKFVDRSWLISEDVAGGSMLSVTPQWNGSEELTDFDRTNAAVGLTNDDGATYDRPMFDAATGTDPYSLMGELFTDVGTFAVSSVAEVTCDFMTVYLKDNNGDNLAGGELEYREGGGNPWVWATEIADGVFCVETERYQVGLRIHYGPQQIKVGAVPTNEDYTFQTELVTVELRNNGVLGTNGAYVDYVCYGFQPFGTTGDDGLGIVQQQMLPLTYNFRIFYDGLSDDKTETISSTNNVITFDENDLKSGLPEENDENVFVSYPNPFSTSTTIAFVLSVDEQVSVSVYDLQGNFISQLYDGMLEKGNHKINWDAINIQKGVYVVRLISTGNLYTKSIIKM